MAFWGVEVKPGKPFTHSYDDTRGRLRVCQATLGLGKGTAKSVLQCNVGKKSPVLICSLIPDKAETCHLELEFEEDEDVVFSVLGQKSVHLSGYYIGLGHSRGEDESDSYGEDIGEEDSENDESFYGDSEEEYDADFIDDGDLEMFPPSPQRKSSVILKEIEDDDKPANGNANRRRLKKKNQLSDTDEGEDDSRQLVLTTKPSLVLESEDEDGFPISTSLKKKNTASTTEENKSGDMTADEDRKRKTDTITDNVQSERETSPADNSLPLLDNTATNDTLKKKNKVEETTSVTAVEAASTKLEQDADDNDVEGRPKEKDSSTGVELHVTEKDEKKKKKKKKEKAKKAKSQGGSVDRPSTMTKETETEDTNIVKNSDDMDEDKRLGKELNEIKVDSNEKKKKKKRKIKNDLSEGMSADKDVEAGKDKKLIDSPANNDLTKMVSDTDAAQPESKKKKKSKTSSQDLSDMTTAKERAESQKPRTFANGLVVEELSMGKPDGKKASPGSKVSVNYIGKLKNGKIFDSNVGAPPFKFRLGVGQVIKGWDVGVVGMRVGDKRKLTIPPAMGYGAKNAGKIPANSWLVFDVELIDVK